jgi:hypothetical protein
MMGRDGLLSQTETFSTRAHKEKFANVTACRHACHTPRGEIRERLKTIEHEFVRIYGKSSPRD